jgi:hypothetical protein
MRLIIFTTAFALLSCGQKSDKGKEKSLPDDTINIMTDTVKTNRQDSSIVKDNLSTADLTDEATINNLLKTKFADKWHVLTDKEAGWDKNIYDNNIAGKKKKDPNFPYITKGDFNGDGKIDYAAIVTDNGHTENKIAIIAGAGHIVIWGDDYVGNGTLETIYNTDLKGVDNDGNEKQVKMKGDGIKVIMFDVGGYTIYWNGSSYKYLSMEL